MKNFKIIIFVLGIFLLVVFTFILFQKQKAPQPTQNLKQKVPLSPPSKSLISKKQTMEESLKIYSPDFSHNEFIPPRFTCEGEDVNPTLIFENIPEGAKSLVLIMDDPDAPMGTFDHWIVFNIPPNVTKIEENSVPQGAQLGKNHFGRLEYGGPCPPPGNPHRYFFKLYAVDTVLELQEGASKEEVLSAIKDHILAQAELIGLYKR